MRPDQKIDPALAEAGRAPYTKSCKRCHGDNGRQSAEPQYPVVAGQWLETLQISIAEVRSGKRKVDEKFLAKLDELKPAEADAVLHFFAAQK
ncbi:MAG TPA: c-type cytochrome [Azonexus sp.]